MMPFLGGVGKHRLKQFKFVAFEIQTTSLFGHELAYRAQTFPPIANGNRVSAAEHIPARGVKDEPTTRVHELSHSDVTGGPIH